VPELFVSVTTLMETKLKMLDRHENQRQWPDGTQQSLDDYTTSCFWASAKRRADSFGWQSSGCLHQRQVARSGGWPFALVQRRATQLSHSVRQQPFYMGVYKVHSG